MPCRLFVQAVHDGAGIEHQGQCASAARRVAGGLESLVMGEGQILAQVKNVYNVGQNAPGFGRQLNGLFKQVTPLQRSSFALLAPRMLM